MRAALARNGFHSAQRDTRLKARTEEGAQHSIKYFADSVTQVGILFKLASKDVGVGGMKEEREAEIRMGWRREEGRERGIEGGRN